MMPQSLLAQVSVGGTWSTLLGISLASSGVALYALRSLRPKLARDYDIFFAAVALLCGGILFFQGWRQDPILQFGQFLLTGSAIFFAVESIRLRGIATEQAKRNTPIVDEDRPVSSRYVYNAELDDFDAIDERVRRPRIQGSRDVRDQDEYEEARPRRRSSTDDRLPGQRSQRKSRPRPEDTTVGYTDYTESRTEKRDDAETPRRRPRSRPEDTTVGYTDFTESRDDADSSTDRPVRSRRTSAPTDAGNATPATRPRRSRPSSEDADSPRSRERDRPREDAESTDFRAVDDNEEDNWS
jgi:hypothetical protein